MSNSNRANRILVAIVMLVGAGIVALLGPRVHAVAISADHCDSECAGIKAQEIVAFIGLIPAFAALGAAASRSAGNLFRVCVTATVLVWVTWVLVIALSW